MLVPMLSMSSMLRRAIQCAVVFGFLSAARAQPIEIKMGTLAPEGSPWHKVLERMGERWRDISGGKVRPMRSLRNHRASS